MNIDLGSFAFGSTLKSGGGTCSWGTAFGQSKPAYKYTYPGFESVVIGMLYCSAPKSFFSMPLGKGGHIFKGDEDDTIQLTSIFHNVFVNGEKIDYPFLMAIVKEESASHLGRRSLKYSDKISYNDGNKQYSNEVFISVVCDTFDLAYSACWFVYAIDIKNQDELHLKIVIVDAKSSLEYVDSMHRKSRWLELIPASEYLNNRGDEINTNIHFIDNSSLQTIYYGAPGTGKSYKIKSEVLAGVVEENIFRTTFHPDYDYASFVGCYKPKKDVDKITYSFVPQVFTNAYVKAWNEMKNEETKQVYLVIEEINRGNCAQIFGDLFQLLDRKDDGYSEYTIDIDEDLKNYLLNAVDDKENPILDNKEGIRGDKLCLPPNLNILATMNTSDQSLFPMDSAFKRRWEWEYVKIAKGTDKNGNELDWRIGVQTGTDWWDFIQKINAIIASMTSSADKQLGYFFCKADDKGVISYKTFVNKVCFYLWNDVFKDYGFEDKDLFRYKETINEKEETKDLTFPDFFNNSDEDGICKLRVDDFIQKVLDWKSGKGGSDN